MREGRKTNERALTRESPEVPREGETRSANCAEERDTEFNNRLAGGLVHKDSLTGPNRECDGWTLKKTHVQVRPKQVIPSEILLKSNRPLATQAAA